MVRTTPHPSVPWLSMFMPYDGPSGTNPAAVVRETESPTNSTLMGGAGAAGGGAAATAVVAGSAGGGAVTGGTGGGACSGSSVGLGAVTDVRPSLVRAATERVVKTDARVTRPRTAI